MTTLLMIDPGPEGETMQNSNMDSGRWISLMEDDDLPLTQDEIDGHWHFCVDWDGLLVGPGMMEMEHCGCFPPEVRS